MIKLYIDKAQDRETVACILIRNGYTVKQSKEKSAGSKSFIWYLEFAKDGETSILIANRIEDAERK
ncbi:MAG: hypothetical protein RR235_07350 [Oscillospiraceae bacterium]